jgi:hypothetical protein
MSWRPWLGRQSRLVHRAADKGLAGHAPAVVSARLFFSPADEFRPRTSGRLGALAVIGDDVHSQGEALRRQVRDAWLKVYASFNPQQKAIVRELMQARMDRAETFRQRMRQHFGGG